MASLRLLTLVCCLMAVRPTDAAEYAIDFALVLDFEQLRPLVELCEDLGSMESKNLRLNMLLTLKYCEGYLSPSDMRSSVGVRKYRRLRV